MSVDSSNQRQRNFEISIIFPYISTTTTTTYTAGKLCKIMLKSEGFLTQKYLQFYKNVVISIQNQKTRFVRLVCLLILGKYFRSTCFLDENNLRQKTVSTKKSFDEERFLKKIFLTSKIFDEKKFGEENF